MNQLETIILTCRDVSYFSQLHMKIQNSNQLTESDKNLFSNIWEQAIDYDNWNNADLNFCCQKTHQKLKETFKMPDEVISIIVRVASYDWK